MQKAERAINDVSLTSQDGCCLNCQDGALQLHALSAGAAAEPSQEDDSRHSALPAADARDCAWAPAQAARAAPPGGPAPGPHHPGWRAFPCG